MGTTSKGFQIKSAVDSKDFKGYALVRKEACDHCNGVWFANKQDSYACVNCDRTEQKKGASGHKPKISQAQYKIMSRLISEMAERNIETINKITFNNLLKNIKSAAMKGKLRPEDNYSNFFNPRD